MMVLNKLSHKIHVSTCHGVHNIIIYNIWSYNFIFNFPFVFKISLLFVGIYEYIS